MDDISVDTYILGTEALATQDFKPVQYCVDKHPSRRTGLRYILSVQQAKFWRYVTESSNAVVLHTSTQVN